MLQRTRPRGASYVPVIRENSADVGQIGSKFGRGARKRGQHRRCCSQTGQFQAGFGQGADMGQLKPILDNNLTHLSRIRRSTGTWKHLSGMCAARHRNDIKSEATHNMRGVVRIVMCHCVAAHLPCTRNNSAWCFPDFGPRRPDLGNVWPNEPTSAEQSQNLASFVQFVLHRFRLYPNRTFSSFRQEAKMGQLWPRLHNK